MTESEWFWEDYDERNHDEPRSKVPTHGTKVTYVKCVSNVPTTCIRCSEKFGQDDTMSFRYCNECYSLQVVYGELGMEDPDVVVYPDADY